MGCTSKATWTETRVRVAWIVLFILCVMALAFPARADAAADAKGGDSAKVEPCPSRAGASEDPPPTREDKKAGQRRWFLLLATVNVYPGLESEELLDIFNVPMHILAPGYDDVRTFGDTRDDHIMWPPHFGVGRVLSDNWSVFLYGGYSAGTVHTEATNVSLFGLPLHHDVEIRRGAGYLGIGADYSPFGGVKLGKYRGFMERLRAARPSLGARYVWTYATYDAKVKVGFEPFGSAIRYKQSDSWLIPSVNVNVGADVPLSPHGALTMDAGYSFFRDRGYDFAGWNYTIGYKWYFR